MEWYYSINGSTTGPVDREALVQLVQSGQLRQKDLVWNSSMGENWTPVSEIDFLRSVEPVNSIAAVSVPESAGTGGQTHNRDLMAQAREALRGRWGIAVGVFLLYQVIITAVGFVPFFVGTIATYIVAGPFGIGLALFTLAISRNQEAGVARLFDGFKQFGTGLCAYLLMMLFITLWMLLLIIPGIVAALAYSMTFFIVADDPTIRASDALKKSKAIMMGNKWKYFCLTWRFFGWGLLCILTLGIGFLWLMPYMQVSYARFYEDVRE